jgi:tetratricopeptide (TPR) repeat protein
MHPSVIFTLCLTLLAVTGIGQAAAQQGEARVALVIGNAAYPDAEAPLRDPVKNMRAVAEELRRVDFDVDTGENLTKQEMRTALDRFYGKIKSGTTAVLFFSGYGIQSARQTYMVPTNAQIWIESDLRRDGFTLDSALAEMNTRGARVKIAILDASRRNPFERRFRAVAEGLAPASSPPSTVVMYAAAPGVVVRDNERELFVSELLKELRVPGKIEEAFQRTLIGVSRASQGEQVPWFSSSLVEDFSFATAARPSSAPTSTVDSERKPPAPAPDREADARRDYQVAERVGTRKAWEDFIAKHPSGRYHDLARDKIAKLDVPSVRPKQVEPAVAPPVQPKPAEPAVAAPVKPMARLDNAAIRELDKAIQYDPDDATAFYKRGQLFAKNGDFQRAIEDFDKAIRLNPKDAEAFNNRCWSRAIVGELQPALVDCNEALKIRPRYLDALDSRGFVRLKSGQLSSAIADYDAALQINPKHASSLYGRGIAKVRSGNTTGGNGDIAAAKLIQPDIADEFAGYGIR